MIEATLALLFGLLIGSFLNVCIHRWPRGRSVVRPRSHCVRCRKTIAWYDNVPVLSYLLLRGRCRYCGKHISARYPGGRIAHRRVFFYFFWTRGPGLAAVKLCVFGAMLIALIFSDLEKRILPDELTLGGALIGLAFAPFVPLRDESSMGLFWLLGLELSGRVLSLCQAAARRRGSGVLSLGRRLALPEDPPSRRARLRRREADGHDRRVPRDCRRR